MGKTAQNEKSYGNKIEEKKEKAENGILLDFARISNDGKQHIHQLKNP